MLLSQSLRDELRRMGKLPPEEEPRIALADECRLLPEAVMRGDIMRVQGDDDESESDSPLNYELAADDRVRACEARELPALPSKLPSPDELVSVVCPTSAARHWAHPLLYRSFVHQTHPRKELVILDTDGEASPFFTQLNDARVRYYHVAPSYHSYGGDASSDPVLAAAARGCLSLGGKRNWLSRQASGTLIANFDDDDYYMPNYVERMCSALRTYDADLVKLGSWVLFDTREDVLSYYEDAAKRTTSSAMHGHRWGFGFTYVCTAETARAHGYAGCDMGEDYAFVLDAARGGRTCLAFADPLGDATVVHVSHGRNTSIAQAHSRQVFGGIGESERFLEQLGPHGTVARAVLDAVIAARAPRGLSQVEASKRLEKGLASIPLPPEAARPSGAPRSEAPASERIVSERAPAEGVSDQDASQLLHRLHHAGGEQMTTSMREVLRELLRDRPRLDRTLRTLGMEKVGQRLRFANELARLAEL